MGPPSDVQVNLKVADLLRSSSGEWDTARIQLILPDYEDLIMALKPSRTGAQDKLVWLGMKYGDYTAKSGYFAAVDNEDEGVMQNGAMSRTECLNEAVMSRICHVHQK